MRALGVHVFAGGFTMGVRRVADVVAQLEVHDFGGDTVRAMGIPFINAASWREWPKYAGVDLVYGNPRCTGFSCITAGYGEDAHGPWSNQTKDVHELCQYGVNAGIDTIIWESVQQAYSVGRELLDYLRDELFKPNGYRIAHVFINAASFGNAQTRRRYFFVAYRGRNFNIDPPKLPTRHATVRDVIGSMSGRTTNAVRLSRPGAEYDRDTHTLLNEREQAVVPHLGPKMCLNKYARLHTDELKRVCHKYWKTWVERASSRPFSLHCISRIRWDYHCPTLHSSCSRLIHPEHDRPLTVGELATLMGWGDVLPRGDKPVHQIAKGVVPDVGEWLAKQVALHRSDAWGRDDWSTRYDHRHGAWKGERHTSQPVEKVLDMTQYYPALKETGDATVQQR